MGNFYQQIPLPVTQGGIGVSTLSGVAIGNGTSAFTAKTNPSGAFVGDTDVQTLTNKTLTTPTLQTWDGWIDANESWTFASSTTITVPTDATTKYKAGDRIRFTQSGTTKYGYIYSVTSTLLTVLLPSGVSVTNVAITGNGYSRDMSGLGFPPMMSYSPGFTGFSVNPTVTAVFTYVDGMVIGNIYATGTGTSNANNFLITLPVPASSATDVVGRANSNAGFVDFNIAPSATQITMYFSTGSATGWATSGNKYGSLSFVYRSVWQ